MPRCRPIILALWAVVLLGAAASAQDASPPGEQPPAEAAPLSQPAADPEAAGGERPEVSDRRPDPADRQISLQVELYPWFPAPGGRYVLPGETRGGRDVDVEDLNIDSPRLGPAGTLRLAVDEWSFSLSGAEFSTDRRTDAPFTRPIGDIDISEGDALRTRSRFTTGQLMVGNTFFQRSLHAFDYPESRFALELEASLGARIDHFDISIEREAGGEASADELFLFPLAGFEARFKPSPRTTLSFATTAGWNPNLGGKEVVTSDFIVRAGLQVSPRVQVMAGYRITIQRMDTGDGADRFEFNGSHAGLFGGLRIGF